MDILDLLRQRGLLANCTNFDALAELLETQRVTFYVGFDPTGHSLHVGHLLPIMAMRWLQNAGHRPIVVMGGGTAMVGDPSGRDQTRELLSEERIRYNRERMERQLARFLDLDRAIVVNNAEWLRPLHYIDFLRDVGRHFSVNQMLSAEGVRQRLERHQGLSFIEFNYHLLQSYDFLELYRNYGCVLQIGGDDQWFHILGGVELIRRETGATVHGFTVPLLETADGKKMGKTEAGAVWLDPDSVSPYDYYQYWVNVHDADVGRLLRLFTMLDLAEIARLDALEGADIREAKRVLALEATALAHGRTEAERAAEAARQTFAGGLHADMPTHRTPLPASLVEIMHDAGLVKSRSEARRVIRQGGARVDRGLGKESVTDIDYVLDGEAVVWKGKKQAVRVVKND